MYPLARNLSIGIEWLFHEHAHPDPGHRGHAHDVDLEDTFDFLNTDDTENGFPVEQAADARRRPRPGSSIGASSTCEGADRVRAQAAEPRPADGRDLARVHAVRTALREVAQAVAEQRAPEPARSTTINRALHARQVIELVPAPDGVLRRPSPRRRPGRRRARPPGRPARDRADRGSPGADQDLRQRHLPTGSSTTTSRTSRRRWCDMATCGNRAKAARHRARRRSRGHGGRPRRRRRPASARSESPVSLTRQARSRIGRTSVANRVIDSSSYGDGKPATRWR